IGRAHPPDCVSSSAVCTRRARSNTVAPSKIGDGAPNMWRRATSKSASKGVLTLLALRAPTETLVFLLCLVFIRHLADRRPDQLEILADQLPLAERDRFAVEDRFGHLLVLVVVGLLDAALGLLAGLGRRRRLSVRRAFARGAG